MKLSTKNITETHNVYGDFYQYTTNKGKTYLLQLEKGNATRFIDTIRVCEFPKAIERLLSMKHHRVL